MKILMQNRNPQTWLGEDSECMTQLMGALSKKGIGVDFTPREDISPAGCDLVHLYNINFPWTYNQMACARAVGKPIVISPFFYRDHHPSPVWRQQEVIDYASAVICASPREAKDLERYYGAAVAQKTQFVPWGVDPYYSQEGDAVSLGSPYVFYPMQVFPSKGQHLLINAVAKYRYTVVLSGSWDERAYIETLKTYPGTVMLPNLSKEERARLYRGAGCTVIPSVYEPYCAQALEALACGSPIVISPGLGVSFWAGDWAGEGSPIVDPRNEALFGSRIQRAIRSKLPKDLPDSVRGEFSWDSVADMYIKIYEEVLS